MEIKVEAKLVDVTELSALVSKLREIEKEYSGNCTLLEVSIVFHQVSRELYKALKAKPTVFMPEIKVNHYKGVSIDQVTKGLSSIRF